MKKAAGKAKHISGSGNQNSQERGGPTRKGFDFFDRVRLLTGRGGSLSPRAGGNDAVNLDTISGIMFRNTLP